MKKTVLVCGIYLAAASAVFAQATSVSDNAKGPKGPKGPKNVDEHLTGYQEDPLALSTSGHGDFHGRISNDGTQFAYELKYTGLADILQAHIHFGGHSQSGGIMVFLCTNQGNGPAGTQTCPAPPATITGVIDAGDILAPAGQGIAAGEFDEFLDAIRADTAYVNVHTTAYTGGEIRANIGGPKGPGHDHK